MGGNGALHYAARHPDLFVAAASFSGANDVFHPILYPITETTEISNGATPGSVFGPRLTQEVRWRASNPVDLAGNLGATWVSLAFGTGFGASEGLPVDPIEIAVHDANVAVHQQPRQGAHPARVRRLRRREPQLALLDQRPGQGPAPADGGVRARTGSPRRRSPTPRSSRRTASSGGRLRLTRPELEWSRLEKASARGFVLQRQRHRESSARPRPTVRARGSPSPSTTPAGIASCTGPRQPADCQIAVDLGPANAFQQYTVPALLTGTTVRTARVTIS